MSLASATCGGKVSETGGSTGTQDGGGVGDDAQRSADACHALPATGSLPDGGPCDDSEPAGVSNIIVEAKSGYSVDCDPQPLDAPGCKGLLDDAFGGCSLPRCAARRSYPVGCNVALPSENPFYPGHPQNCQCSSFTLDGAPGWVCPL